MPLSFVRWLTALAFLTLSASVAVADDWLAEKLRGQVLQLVDGAWQPLQRGDVVPDSRVVRTLALGHVSFTRGEETIDVGPNTQIQIYDKAKAGKPFTTVKQYFGTVSVEAEVRQVQHFAVETPYLAAVVKGTRFTVVSGRAGSSVSVQRGHVAVEDERTKSHVLLAAGQSAKLDVKSTGGELQVGGKGKLPVVLSKKGVPLTSATGKPVGPLSTKRKGGTDMGKSGAGDSNRTGKGGPDKGDPGNDKPKKDASGNGKSDDDGSSKGKSGGGGSGDEGSSKDKSVGDGSGGDKSEAGGKSDDGKSGKETSD